MYLYDNKVVFFCLVTQVVISIVGIVIQKIGYYKLLKISENMGDVRDVNIKNISNNKKNVNNVDNYVDKYVYSFKICGLKLYTISRICGYLLNFLFITWSILCIYGVYLEVDIKEILWIVMLGILIVGGLFNLGANVDNYKMEKIAKINIKDYIENMIQMSKRKEEMARVRKDKVKNNSINMLEKTIVDFEYNNANVVEMDKDVFVSKEENTFFNNRLKNNKISNEELKDNDKSNNVLSTSGKTKEDIREKKAGLNSDNLGYLSEYMSINTNEIIEKNKGESMGVKINDEEERIIEGFLRQYFA